MSNNLSTPTHLVLVTGCTQGLGEAIVKKLAKENDGYHILMAGRRKDAIDSLAAKLQTEGLSVEPLVLDLESDESIDAAVKYIDDKFGRLDVLINNAAASDGGTGVRDRQAWMRLFSTNVFGVALLTDALLPLLAKSQQTKRIVFLSTNLTSMTYRLDPSQRTDNPAYHNSYRVYTCSKGPVNCE